MISSYHKGSKTEKPVECWSDEWQVTAAQWAWKRTFCKWIKLETDSGTYKWMICLTLESQKNIKKRLQQFEKYAGKAKVSNFDE